MRRLQQYSPQFLLVPVFRITFFGLRNFLRTTFYKHWTNRGNYEFGLIREYMTENFTGGTDKSTLKPESKSNWHERWWREFVFGHKYWSMIKGNLKSLKNTVSFLKLKLCSIKLNVSIQSHRMRRNRQEYNVEDA